MVIVISILSLPKAKGNTEARKQKNKLASKSIATGRIAPSRLTECLEEATGRVRVNTIQRGCFLFFLRNHTLFHCTYLYSPYMGVPPPPPPANAANADLEYRVVVVSRKRSKC